MKEVKIEVGDLLVSKNEDSLLITKKTKKYFYYYYLGHYARVNRIKMQEYINQGLLETKSQKMLT